MAEEKKPSKRVTVKDLMSKGENGYFCIMLRKNLANSKKTGGQGYKNVRSCENQILSGKIKHGFKKEELKKLWDSVVVNKKESTELNAFVVKHAERTGTAGIETLKNPFA